MSEYGVNNTGKPPEVGTSAYWAQLGGSDWSDAANVSTPDPARRSTGVLNGEGAVSAWYNWTLSVIFRILDWLSSRFNRTFDDFTEAVGAVDYGHLFTVSIDSPRVAPWTRIDDDSPSPVDGVGLCTDGEFIYVLDNGVIYSLDPGNTTTAILTQTEHNTTDVFNSMTSDGRFIYMVYDDGSGAEVYIVERDDLSLFFPGISSAANNVQKCVGNGESFVYYGSTNIAFFYTLFPFSLDGSEGHGGAINDIAIDHGLAYIAGDAGTGGNHVRAVELDGTLASSFILPSTSGTPTAESVCCDGEFVYVFCNNVTDSAGGNYNLIVLNRDLIEVDRYNIASISDATRCCVDGRYIACVDQNNSFAVVEKRTGRLVFLDDTGDIRTTHCDCNGESFFVLSTSGEIVRYRRGALSGMIFRKEDPTDPVRMPMLKRANPINGF